MLNSQPLGFYFASQHVQDGRRHGVEVRPVDVMHSEVDCALEDIDTKPAVRLGLRLISSLRSVLGRSVIKHRSTSQSNLPYVCIYSSTR